MNEAKAAFAELTIRSIKNTLHRYMEEFGYKYIHNFLHFITTSNCSQNSPVKWKPNDVKSPDLHSLQQTSTRVQKTKFKNWR